MGGLKKVLGCFSYYLTMLCQLHMLYSINQKNDMNDKIEAMEASIDGLSKDIISAFTWGTQKTKKLSQNWKPHTQEQDLGPPKYEGVNHLTVTTG